MPVQVGLKAVHACIYIQKWTDLQVVPGNLVPDGPEARRAASIRIVWMYSLAPKEPRGSQPVLNQPKPLPDVHFYTIHITLILHETSGSVCALAWGWDGKLFKKFCLLTRHFCIKWALWHVGGGIFSWWRHAECFWVEWSAEYFKIPSARKEKPRDKNGSRILNYLITLTALVLIYFEKGNILMHVSY